MAIKNKDKERRQNLIILLVLIAFMIFCVVSAIIVRDSPLLVGIIGNYEVTVEGKAEASTPSLYDAIEALNSPTVPETEEIEITSTPFPGALGKTVEIIRIFPVYAYFVCGVCFIIAVLIVGGFLLFLPADQE